ncbi:MAG: nucleotidyltransferase domain-containing protein [Planctomycetes bacterium]|nr:nucleotidyltransferase domain-containing protein [Planctomycetota bacterium]MBI3848316.1 nucleotidyltransferase domain-containing protein [Planctomycetota bacterium]
MLDLPSLARCVEKAIEHPLFITVSGAHLYGFPSPDSDVDLRGCHQLPLADVLGVDKPEETIERKLDHDGVEIELVSHEARKYLSLLLGNNGYVLEQIFSPIVVIGESFLERIRPIARRCITRRHVYHYRGFLATQRRLLEKEEPKRAKTLLYAYRVAMTGIHLMRTGEVESNLPRLNESFRLPFIDELIRRKREERIGLLDLDWSFHDARLRELEATLEAAWERSTLPEARDREGVNRLLVALRLDAAS